MILENWILSKLNSGSFFVAKIGFASKNRYQELPGNPFESKIVYINFGILIFLLIFWADCMFQILTYFVIHVFFS